jgi:gamma-glutamyltranspeptidase/glutathione hydrolase
MSNFSLSSEPNLVQPRKQPRSSICPTVVLRDGKPAMVVGSPGAARIICTVVEVIVNAIDYKMDAREANWAPRFYCEKFEDYLFLEGGIDDKVSTDLERMGHTLRKYEGRDLFFGGVQMILVDPVTGMYYGSADKRRGGVALGY